MMAKRKRQNRVPRNNKERFATRERNTSANQASSSETTTQESDVREDVAASTGRASENTSTSSQEEHSLQENDSWRSADSLESLDFLKQEDHRRERALNERKQQHASTASIDPEDAELSFLSSSRPFTSTKNDSKQADAFEDQAFSDSGIPRGNRTFDEEERNDSAPLSLNQDITHTANRSERPDPKYIGLEHVEIEPSEQSYQEPEASEPARDHQPYRYRSHAGARAQERKHSLSKGDRRVAEVQRSKNVESAPAIIDICVVQEMDFRLSSDLKKKKPNWIADPFIMSFTTEVSEVKLGAALKKYPAWLSSFRENEGVYRNSVCIQLAKNEKPASESQSAKNDERARKSDKNKATSSFEEEFLRALDPLTSILKAKQRSEETQAQNFRIDEEHIIIDGDTVIEDEAAREQEAIEVSGVDAWLFYDTSLRQWQIIYRFTLEMQDDRLKALLDASRVMRAERADLYNLVRDLFTVSSNANKVAPTIRKIQAQAKTKAARICKRLYGFKKIAQAQKIFSFPSDRCDVSFFINARDSYDLEESLVAESALAEREHNDLFDLFAGYRISNKAIERDVKLFRFGGRFNTILIGNDGTTSLSFARALLNAYEARFMPLLFHSMLMQSYSAHTTAAIQQIEQSILSDTCLKEPARTKYFDALANSIEYAHFENEMFKRGAELDNELAYARIEEKWSISRSIKQMQDFANHLTDQIEREQQKHTLSYGRKRNGLLVLIVFLILIILIIVWGKDLVDVVDAVFLSISTSEPVRAIGDAIESLDLF